MSGSLFDNSSLFNTTATKIVIMDNDNHNDVGDYGDVAYAAALARLGAFKLAGCNNCTPSYYGPASFKAIVDRCFGTQGAEDNDVLFGWTSTGTINNGIAGVAPIVAKRFGKYMRGQNSFMSDVRLYRTIFASAPAKSVYPILCGVATGFLNFLNSPADDISPLTGTVLCQNGLAALCGEIGFFTSFNTPNSNIANSPTQWASIISTVSAFADCVFIDDAAGPNFPTFGAPLAADWRADPWANVFAIQGTAGTTLATFSATCTQGQMTVTGTVSGTIVLGGTLTSTGTVAIPYNTRVVGLISGTLGGDGVYSISSYALTITTAQSITCGQAFGLGRTPWAELIIDWVAFGAGPWNNLAWGGQNGTVTINTTNGSISNYVPNNGGRVSFLSAASTSNTYTTPVSARFNATTAKFFSTNTLVDYPYQLDPVNIEGIVAAFEPYIAANVTGAGTTGMTVYDRVTKGNWVVPTSAGDSGTTAPTPTGPTIATNDKNGLQTCVFDGTANCLAQDSVAQLFNGGYQPIHVMGLIEITNVTPASTLFDIAIANSANAANNRIRFSMVAGGGSLLFSRYQGAVYGNGGGTGANTWFTFDGVFDPRWDVSDQVGCFINDVFVSTSKNGGSLVTTEMLLRYLRIGQGFGISSSTAVAPIAAHVAYMYFFNRPVEMIERDRVLRYLAGKWALTGIPT